MVTPPGGWDVLDVLGVFALVSTLVDDVVDCFLGALGRCSNGILARTTHCYWKGGIGYSPCKHLFLSLLLLLSVIPELVKKALLLF